MKKKSAFGMFLVGFIRSAIIILVLVAVGFLSYKITKFYYKVTDVPRDSKVREAIQNIVSDAKVEDISKNLIYCTDKKSKKIKHVVLEIFNTNTYNLDYITIPTDMEFTMSNELYQKISGANPDVPQIIRMMDLNEYFKKETAYQYGMILVKDALDIESSYYTAVDEESYDNMFATKKYEFKTEVFNNKMIEQAKQFKDIDTMKSYIKKIYKNLASNLTLNNKLKYAEPFTKVNSEFIHFYTVLGENTQTGFILDKEATKELLNKLLENKAYINKQDLKAELKEKEVLSSKEKQIKILNGSRITGLASTYKENLEKEGYNILPVGDYKDEIYETTKIIVKEEGYGQDLVKYFKDPIIETGDNEYGVDILIILGKADLI